MLLLQRTQGDAYRPTLLVAVALLPQLVLFGPQGHLLSGCLWQHYVLMKCCIFAAPDVPEMLAFFAALRAHEMLVVQHNACSSFGTLCFSAH